MGPVAHPAKDEAAPHAKGLPHGTRAGGRWAVGRRPAAAAHGTIVEHQRSDNRSCPSTKGPIGHSPANKQPLAPTSSQIAPKIKGPPDRSDQPNSCTSI